MQDTIQVKTPPGQICPKEGRHRDYIIDATGGSAVPDSTFYRRLIEEGSLILCEAAPEKTEKTAKTKEATAHE